jgi:hypothetical protein
MKLTFPIITYTNVSTIDTDECNTGTPCGANGVCYNLPGSYACVCHTGYEWDGSTCIVSTVDMCSSNPCVCDFGYEWDGSACTGKFFEFLHCKP